MMGPTMRHGPHQGAQQSTRTGRPFDCNTSRWNVASVTTTGLVSCPLLALFPGSNVAPHRPHFASLEANRCSSTRFFVPHLLQTTTCISSPLSPSMFSDLTLH